MNNSIDLIRVLQAQQPEMAKVVPIDFEHTPFLRFDFSKNNSQVAGLDLNLLEQMEAYVQGIMQEASVKVAVGGYGEERDVYQRSPVFDTEEGESRSIHLGVDVWMEAGTPVFTPLEAVVHSFQDNAHFGDYGPTIILSHQLEGITFYTLYGHLSRRDLHNIREGQILTKGTQIGHIGSPEENGQWTPHLHFQIIRDMLGKKGDFIGVAPKAMRDYYLDLCPDPNLILQAY